MKVPKVYQELFDIAVAQGWRVEQRKNTHLSWVAPDGTKVFSSFTPSDHRAVKNLKRDLRRYGLKI